MPFKSTVGDYQTVATLETFGFLPPFTQDEIYDQIAYIIAQGWSPLVEHVHPSNSMATYWSYWKLPFFGEKDLSVIVSELEACHRAYPDHHVRLVGYDAYTRARVPASWCSKAADLAVLNGCGPCVSGATPLLRRIGAWGQPTAAPPIAVSPPPMPRR